MSLMKCVNGEHVAMSPEEEAAIRAEWAAEAAKPIVVSDPVEKLRAYLAANPDVRAMLES